MNRAYLHGESLTLKIIESDVLIIGSGGAALRAAVEAKETFPGGRITILTKGEMGKCGVTAISCSDRMAFHATLPYTEPGGPDNWKHHARDIFQIGGFVSDADLAAILARESGEAFQFLDGLGVPFAKISQGKADQFITDGSEYARACYTGPRTANHIEEGLVRRVSSLDIQLVEHCMACDLLLEAGRVIGAIGVDTREGSEPLPGRVKIFLSKAVILATGGAGEIFAVHVYPPGMTGDGYAMAYRAGAELVNMEFIQIGLASVKTQLNCSGSLMRANPRFVNDLGEEFLPRYFPPDTPFSVIHNLCFEKGSAWPVSREKKTHRIDVAVSKETAQGRKVFLDYSRNPSGFRFQDLEARWQERYKRETKGDGKEEERNQSPLTRLKEINPESVEWLKEKGINLEGGELLEIAEAGQHFQGGVKIRERGNTALRGLYAAGECAGGQHGANRPGGNALLDGQVFGRITGRAAALEAKENPGAQKLSKRIVEPALKRLEGFKKGKLPAAAAREEIKKIVSRCAGVVRTERELTEGLEKLEKIKEEGIFPDPKGVAFTLETENLLTVAEMVMRAAFLRKESRGPHLFFVHFDDLEPIGIKGPEWQKYIVIRREEDKMILQPRTPVGMSF
jgi:succinate dehydrogenase / fumarate reductase flavoprotein subunit